MFSPNEVSKMFDQYKGGESLQALAWKNDTTDETVRNNFLRLHRSEYMELQTGSDKRVKRMRSPHRATKCLMYLYKEEDSQVAKFGICNIYRLNPRRRELHSHSGFKNVRLIKAVEVTADIETKFKRFLGQKTETISTLKTINKALKYMEQFEEYQAEGNLYLPVESRF